jgi:HSP20 family molecular chaperone IbpA
MKRSIPPRTMRDVSRSQRKRRDEGPGIRLFPGIGLRLQIGRDQHILPRQRTPSAEPTFSTGLFEKPRNWRFQTKPVFKKIRGPLVDVFHEAEEVLIVVDLGGFRRGDILLSIKPEKYTIFAKRGDQEFREEIELTPDVDIDRCVEHFRNEVLEIILPRKKRVRDR